MSQRKPDAQGSTQITLPLCNHLEITLDECYSTADLCANYSPINVYFKGELVAHSDSNVKINYNGMAKFSVGLNQEINGKGTLAVEVYYNKSKSDCGKPAQQTHILKIANVVGKYIPPVPTSSPPSTPTPSTPAPSSSILKNALFWIILVLFVVSVICIILAFVL